MSEISGIAFSGLGAMVAIAVVTWLVSLFYADVSIVDRVWSLFLFAGALTYALCAGTTSETRSLIVLVLVGAWAVRLALYITVRSWKAPEDHRYQAIRARNQPHFAFKSLYLVFMLQAVLAWVISAPLLAIMATGGEPGWLDLGGVVLAVSGIVFEGIADWQMTCFKSHKGSAGRVMDRGLWRYTRHPNYFGECCTWWGIYLVAVAAGGAWSVFAPLLLTLLLLKVSGVSLLEKDIAERRPGYRAYVRRTNAFIPGRPR